MNAVPIPSSLRATAACAIEGWNERAKQKVIPASSATSATRSDGSVSATPSASRTSAEPDLEEAARLPCLTTRTPAPAMTNEDIVEMLTVLARSPPVPTMSRDGPGTDSGRACASISSARPRSSSAVSPLTRSAMSRPAVWAGVASPDMICPIAHRASPSDR